MLNDKQFWQKLIEEALADKAEYNFLDFKLTFSEQNERMKEHLYVYIYYLLSQNQYLLRIERL